MGTIVITGSAGGIGQATRERLNRDGHEVIGVDIRDAEVIADLSTPEGRTEMIGAVAAASGGRIDGLVAGAGITGPDPEQVVSINYFGAVATVEGLRPLLAQGTDSSAVAISSNSSTTVVALPDGLIDACLNDDEAQARELAGAEPGIAYATSKLALARWVRRTAIGADWIGSGIRLNGVAPGLIDTPLVADNIDMIMNLGDVYPIPQNRPGRPAEVANLLAFLLSPDASFFCGSVVFMDGGSDAALNADTWPAANQTADRWPGME